MLVILIAVQLPRIHAITESSASNEQETLTSEMPTSSSQESEESSEATELSGVQEEEIDKLMSKVEVE